MTNMIPLSDALALEDRPLPHPGTVDSYTRTNAVDVVRVGVIGFGNWGPNIVRNLQGLERGEVVTICDRNPAVLSRAGVAFGGRQMLNAPRPGGEDA